MFYVEVTLTASSDILPKTKRNVASVLVIANSWISLVCGVFRQMHGSNSSASLSHALHRFADFVQLERDICIATLLFLALVGISVLPITYIHSTFIVNQAYAQSFLFVRHRRRLMFSLFSTRLSHDIRRALPRVAPCLQLCWDRLSCCCKRQTGDASSVSLAKVFEPSIVMPERLNRQGPSEIARKWAQMEPVRCSPLLYDLHVLSST